MPGKINGRPSGSLKGYRNNKMWIDKISFITLLLYAASTSLSIVATNVLLGVVVVLAILYSIRARRFRLSAEGIPMLLLLLWRGLSIIGKPQYWYKFGGKFWDHMPYYFIPNLKVKKIKTIVYVFLITATVTAVMGIAQFFLSFKYPLISMQLISAGELYGFNFRNRLHSSGYYSFIAVLCLVFFFFLNEKDRKAKIMLAACSLVNIVAVILSNARTYYVALGIVIIAVLIKKSFKTLVFGGLAIAAVVTMMCVLHPGVKSRFTSIFDTQKNVSNMERLWMWNTSLKIIKENPVFGIGYKNWQIDVEKYFQNEKDKNPLMWILMRQRKEGYDEQNVLKAMKAHPHNSYLSAAVEGGIVGLGLFLLFWAGNMVQAFRRAARIEKGSVMFALNLGVGFALMMFLIGAFFEYNLITARLLLPLTFLMGLSYIKTENSI